MTRKYVSDAEYARLFEKAQNYFQPLSRELLKHWPSIREGASVEWYHESVLPQHILEEWMR